MTLIIGMRVTMNDPKKIQVSFRQENSSVPPLNMYEKKMLAFPSGAFADWCGRLEDMVPTTQKQKEHQEPPRIVTYRFQMPGEEKEGRYFYGFRILDRLVKGSSFFNFFVFWHFLELHRYKLVRR
jgi:hypothetical protein